MSQIAAFRGVRFDLQQVGDLGHVISPPYDVIDADLRARLFDRSAFNIARIIKADPDAGGPEAQPYTAAGALFEQWVADGVLRQDPEPAVYVYEQQFDLAGKRLARTGMVALVRLEEFGKGVMPHERTFSGPKADRLNLLRATRAHFGQIFSLYPDAEGTVDRLLEQAKTAPPLGETTDAEGVTHRLWAITEASTIQEVQQAMAEKALFIADGHHRYETALNYSKERPESESAKYCMMTLVNMANEGLLILPTHRLVRNVADFDPGRLLDAAREHFDVTLFGGSDDQARAEMLEALGQAGEHAFGLYMNDGNHYLLVLRDPQAMDTVADRSETWRRLDATILHTLVLERILGIGSEELAAESNVEYIKDIGPAIDQSVTKVEREGCQAVFFMNATRADQVEAVARAGEKMPQKSTFFYPKVYTGLVINKLDD